MTNISSANDTQIIQNMFYDSSLAANIVQEKDNKSAWKYSQDEIISINYHYYTELPLQNISWGIYHNIIVEQSFFLLIYHFCVWKVINKLQAIFQTFFVN